MSDHAPITSATRGDSVVAMSPAGSAASWPSVIAGAFVAIGVSLILTTLGAGLGFASISPWADHGVSAATLGTTAAAWLIATQWIAACLGGYIAGRLRTRWVGTHTHEVFFRDTAHGLIMWAVSTVAVLAIAGSSVVSAVSGGVRVAAGSASAMMERDAALPSAASAYGVDKLFRMASGAGGAGVGGVDGRGVAEFGAQREALHIAAEAAGSGAVSDEDRAYLTTLVGARTGLGQAEAQKRVDEFSAAVADAVNKAKTAADEARRAAAQTAIYMALALLVGAFIASVSAALGGHLRDEHP